MIHFQSIANRVIPCQAVYLWPLYKFLSRAGTLSNTGHSTDYVLYVELPNDVDESVWIKEGVAMFLWLKQ